MIQSGYQPMIIVSHEAVSEVDYNITRLAVLNYSKHDDDVVWRSKKQRKVVTNPGMPQCYEYVSTLEIREVTVISKIDSDSIKTELIDDDMVECTTLQPIIIKYDVEAGIYQMPIVARMDKGVTFTTSLDTLSDKQSFKALIALEAVNYCEFPPLKYALRQSMESAL